MKDKCCDIRELSIIYQIFDLKLDILYALQLVSNGYAYEKIRNL